MTHFAALVCRYQLRTRHFLPADVGDGEWGDWEALVKLLCMKTMSFKNRRGNAARAGYHQPPRLRSDPLKQQSQNKNQNCSDTVAVSCPAISIATSVCFGQSTDLLEAHAATLGSCKRTYDD